MISLKTIALLSMFLLPACSDAEATGGGMVDKIGSAVTQGDAMAKLKGTFTGLQSTLTAITDGTTAQAAKSKLSGMIGPLKDQLGALGGLGKLGSMKDGVVKGIMEQVTRLIGNADIKTAIGPILEKLKSALNG